MYWEFAMSYATLWSSWRDTCTPTGRHTDSLNTIVAQPLLINIHRVTLINAGYRMKIKCKASETMWNTQTDIYIPDKSHTPYHFNCRVLSIYEDKNTIVDNLLIYGNPVLIQKVDILWNKHVIAVYGCCIISIFLEKKSTLCECVLLKLAWGRSIWLGLLLLLFI